MTIHRRSAAAALIGAVCLAAVPWFAQGIGEPLIISLVTRMLIYALAAVSLDLILGIGGMVSFGHAAYFGLGGYVVRILAFHSASGEPLFGIVPGSNLALVAWPAAVAVCTVAALILGALSLRTTGVNFIMITLAFAQVLYFFFVSVKLYGGDDGLIVRQRNTLVGYSLRDPIVFYYLCLGFLAGFLLFCWRLVNSRFGQIIQGARQNERRMAALGANTYPYKLVCFAVAGGAAGLAGALMANYARFVSPDLMHWTESGQLMVMVILGGAGTLFGPVLGAAFIVGLEMMLTSITEHWKFILGPMLVLIVLFTRGGIWGFLMGTSKDFHE
jgi:branched-chain amino acid transport system permease protein